MFPIHDHNPSRGTPWVTLSIIALNLAVYLMTAPWSGDMYGLWAQMALYPAAITHEMRLWGLLTHMFVHASLLHVGGNMLFLWVFGNNLEGEMGRPGFLGFYLLCGLAAAGAEIAAQPLSLAPMVGASGAIAGVMGGYLLLFPRARIDVVLIIVILFKRVTVPAWLLLVLWFSLQLIGGLGAVNDTIAYWAHAGGFLAGMILTIPVFLRNGGPAFWSATQGRRDRPAIPSAPYAPSRIPHVPRRRGSGPWKT